jgi:hypothetical protein
MTSHDLYPHFTTKSQPYNSLTRLSLFIFSHHGSEVIEVKAGETVEISVYTHSTSGAKFSLTDTDKKTPLDGGVQVEVLHTGTEDPLENPSSKKITTKPISGPINVKVKADSNASRFSTHNFLIVFHFGKKG